MSKNIYKAFLLKHKVTFLSHRFIDHMHFGVIIVSLKFCMINIQGGSNMTGTNCDLFTHKQSRSYLNHLVLTL
jgi:hypothetical protein